MNTTSQWLNSLFQKTAGKNVVPDMTLPILVDLYNQGYDRVEWIGSDRCIFEEDTEEICHRYNDEKTTWTLRDFLCITSNYSTNISKTAGKYDYYTTPWDMLNEDQKQDILRTPTNSLNYATAMDFVNLPDEVYTSISRNTNISGNFIYRWLKNGISGNIPQVIIDSSVDKMGDDTWVYYIIDAFKDNPNLPHEFDLFLKGSDTEETYKDKAEGHKYTEADTNVPFDAPIYAHSHVGCKCFLRVYKSTNPSDQVFLDVNGTF